MKIGWLIVCFVSMATIAKAQNVGIGTNTLAVAYKLHVHDTDPTNGSDVSIGITNNLTGTGPLRGARFRLLNDELAISNYETNGQISFATTLNRRMLITAVGNVGINTDNPATVLQVNARPFPATNFNEAIRIGGATPFMSFYDGNVLKGYVQAATDGFEIGTKSAQNMQFYTNNTRQLSILNNGNVGIGDPAPVHPFSLVKNVPKLSNGNNAPALFVKNTADGGGIYSSVENTATPISSLLPSAITGHSVNNTALLGFAEGMGTALIAHATGTGKAIEVIANEGAGINAFSQSGTGISVSSFAGSAIRGTTASGTKPAAHFISLGLGTVALELEDGALKVSGPHPTVFQIVAQTGVGGNVTGNLLTIPNTTLANAATDLLMVTPVYSSSTNVYCNFPIGVWWNGSNWIIFNQSQGAMPNNAVFNVMVVKR